MARTTAKARKAAGRALQDKVTSTIRFLFKVDRGLSPQADNAHIKGKAGGLSGVDVIYSPSISKLIKWAIECKNHAKMNIPSFWRQTLTNAKKENKEPMLIVNYPKFQQPLVIVRYNDYFNQQEELIRFADYCLKRYAQLQELHQQNATDNSLSRLMEMSNTIKKLEEFIPMRDLDNFRKMFKDE